MRPKKSLNIKPGPKLLQQQSVKIQQKLEDLRQQLKQKKKQQISHRNSETVNVNGFLKSKPNITYPSDTRYQDSIKQLKLQQYQTLFKDKGINNYQRLINLTQQEIDQFKQLPVGYRIKLRKFIKEKNITQKKQSKKLANTITQFENAFVKKQNKVSSRDIQDIIKSREASKKFIPLSAELDQEYYQEQRNQQQLNQQQQQSMIKSLMDAFSNRQGIIKNCPSSIHKSNKPPTNIKKTVHWSKQVQEMQQQIENRHKSNGEYEKYPKELSPKLLDNIQTLQDQIDNKQQKSQQQSLKKIKNIQKYCWKCFKKGSINDQLSRSYCSQNCMKEYLQKIRSHEQFLDKHVFSQQIKQNKNLNKKQEILEQNNNQDDVQIIDLSI